MIKLTPQAESIIGYEPKGTLYLDNRRISAEDFDKWRKTVSRNSWESERLAYSCIDYPSNKDLAFRTGVPVYTIDSWLKDGLGPLNASMFRLWLFDDAEIIYEAAPIGIVNALAYACSSITALASELGRACSTVRGWRRLDEVPVKGGAGPLLMTLSNDMSIEPLEKLPPMPNCKFTRSQIRAIRRRRETTDDTHAEIAEDYDVGQGTISRICRRDYYKWVS